MSMDNNNTTNPMNGADDAPMFAPTPSWERAGKKRRFGRSSAAPSAAAPMTSSTLDKPLDAPAAIATPASALDAPLYDPPISQTQHLGGATPVIDPVVETSPIHDSYVSRADTAEAPMMAPIATSRTTKPARKGVPAAALVAGVVALGGIAAAGWYASQPKDDVATLTPGAPGESAMIAPAAPAASTMAANTVAPPTVTTRTTTTTSAPAVVRRTTTTRTTSVRTRPAVAATGASIDTSATLPAGPQSYSADTSVNPPAAKAWNIPSTPPVEPAPAPSASTATPATPAPEPEAAPDASTAP